MKNNVFLNRAKKYYVDIYKRLCDKSYGLNEKQVTINEFIKLNQLWDRAYNRKYNKRED